MTPKSFGPRKRRTRQHVIADQSVNHVERFIIDEGHSAQRVEKDYGYDLILMTIDEEGFAEPDPIFLQLKSRERLQTVGGGYVCDIDIRDYNLWILELLPVVLIVFDASRRRAYWLNFKGYFREDASRRPVKGAKSVRVRLPKRQVVNRHAIRAFRNLRTKRFSLFGERADEKD